MSLAVRSPSEMETSWTIRVQAPGLRNRACLQKGVWSQVRNSSFFQEWTVWEARKMRKRKATRFIFMGKMSWDGWK